MIAIASVALALLTSWRCGTTDGSFSIHDPLADPSAVCRATDLPGLPEGLGGGAALALIYGAPTLVAILGTVIARRRNSRRILRFSVAVTWLMTAAAFVLLLTADVGYRGGP